MPVETNTLVKLREDAAGHPQFAEPAIQVHLGLGNLIEQMQHREATRYYRDVSIDSAWLEQVPDICQRVDYGLFRTDSEESPLQLLTFSRRVSTLSSGIHKYTHEGWQWVAGAEAINISEIVLQPEFAQASAILLLVGSLEAPQNTNSSHHHRRLLSRAGAALEACWLSALEYQYDCSIFAGFIPAELRELGLIDGFRKVQLLALAVGAASHKEKAL